MVQVYPFKSSLLKLFFMEREIEMLKLAQTKELTLEEIKAKLADTAIKERGKKELFAAEAQIKNQLGSGI